MARSSQNDCCITIVEIVINKVISNLCEFLVFSFTWSGFQRGNVNAPVNRVLSFYDPDKTKS
jgi:hypothetical protein